jgi:hypothetical protein
MSSPPAYDVVKEVPMNIVIGKTLIRQTGMSKRDYRTGVALESGQELAALSLP